MSMEAGETVCMTFKGLGEALGMQVESARKLSKKRLWRRQMGNDGSGRVYVPLEYLLSRGVDPRQGCDVVAGGDLASPADLDAVVPFPGNPRTERADPEAPRGDAAAIVMAQLLQQVAGLNDLLASERSRADTEGRRADAERGRADSEGRRADAAEGDRDRWHEEAKAARAAVTRRWWHRGRNAA